MARLCNRGSDGPRTIPRSTTKRFVVVAHWQLALARFFRTTRTLDSIIARKSTGQDTFSFLQFAYSLICMAEADLLRAVIPTSGCVQICVVVVAALLFSHLVAVDGILDGDIRHPPWSRPVQFDARFVLDNIILLYLKMAYVGVEFKENDADQEGAIAIVHSAWLTPLKREVYWPPKQINKKFVRLLQSGADPPEDGTWKLYSVIRVFFETDDYETANKKIKKAEVTSNLDTDAPDESSFLTRKRKRPRKYSISEDEHSSSDHEERRKKEKNKKQLPMPPLLNFNSSGIDLSECYSPSTSVLRRPNPQGTSTISHPASSYHSQPEFPVESDREPRTFTPETPVNQESRPLKQPSAASRSINLSAASTGVTRNPQNLPTSEVGSSLFQQKVLTVLITLKEQNKEIISLLKEKTDAVESKEQKSLPEDFPVDLPIHSENGLDDVENYLRNKNKLRDWVVYLCTLGKTSGGKETVSYTNNILKRCLGDELATRFSFLGSRGEKKPFRNLILNTAIKKAVKEKCDSTEKEIELAIKNWLKYAPQRLRNVLKRNQ